MNLSHNFRLKFYEAINDNNALLYAAPDGKSTCTTAKLQYGIMGYLFIYSKHIQTL